MIKRTLTLFLLIISAKLLGQQTWELQPRIERNAYTTLEGSIDNKYPISMFLKLTWDYCGSNNNDKWNPRIIKGWYEYKKIGKKIPLIGSIDRSDGAAYYLKLFVPDYVLDTLDAKTCSPDKFKEMFFIPVGFTSARYSLDTMQWSKFGQGSFLPVYLKEAHPASWKTFARLTFKIDNI